MSVGDRIGRAVWLAVLVAVAVTPVIFSPVGRDIYRAPKTAFFEGAMLLIAAAAVAAALLSDDVARRFNRARTAILIGAIALGWTAIISFFSLNQVVSRDAPFHVFTHTLLLVLIVTFARRRFHVAMLALLLPAVVNAVVVILQTTGIWSPPSYPEGPAIRVMRVAFLGNANALATYLLVPFVAAAAAMVATRRFKAFYGAAAVLIAVGIVVTETLSVIAALPLIVIGLMIAIPSRRFRIAAAIALLAGTAAVVTSAPFRTRIANIRETVRTGNLADASSSRLPSFAIAYEMFRSRPLHGVGPGVFSSQYMSYRLRVDERHPEWIQPANENLGEVHNDHLQLLAEGGLPAWLLFIAAHLGFAALTFRTSGGDEARTFVRYFALPAAIGFAFIALGQFPLHLTAASSSAVFAGGLCMAWRDDAVA